MVAKFHLRHRRVHLTYAGHLDKHELIKHIGSISPIRFYSCCNEISEDGYYHTHALIHFEKQPNWKDAARVLDYEKVHPNICPVGTDDHWTNTIKYHKKQDKHTYTNYEDIGRPVSVKVQIDKIVKKRKWRDVLLDEDTSGICQARLGWAREVFRVTRNQRDGPPKIYVRWGPSGSGKTRWVKEQFGEYDDVIIDKDGKINGYTGRDVVLIDDFVPEYAPYQVMLKLLDRHACTVRVLYGTMQWNPKVIVITSNYRPCRWYLETSALRRRLDDFGKVEEIKLKK